MRRRSDREATEKLDEAIFILEGMLLRIDKRQPLNSDDRLDVLLARDRSYYANRRREEFLDNLRLSI